MKKGARPGFFGGEGEGGGRAGQGGAGEGGAGQGRAGRGLWEGERGGERLVCALGVFWVSHSRYIYITCLMFLFVFSKTAVLEYFTYYLYATL